MSILDVRLNDAELHRLTRSGANLIIEWNNTEIRIPKILNGHRNRKLKTETELKKLKLMPDAPPVGYSLQQYNGEIFYLYDIDKTKQFNLSDKEKIKLKKYRKELLLRKTCPVCNKVQKYLTDLETRKLFNERYYSCEECYQMKEDEILQERRNVKHDFTSYFINKGIKLNIPIDEDESYDAIYLDFETTGLSAIHDEILQVSIIDQNGRVLLYKLCKPIKNEIWDASMEIHGITPRDVEDELPFEEYIKYIESILLFRN